MLTILKPADKENESILNKMLNIRIVLLMASFVSVLFLYLLYTERLDTDVQLVVWRKQTSIL